MSEVPDVDDDFDDLPDIPSAHQSPILQQIERHQLTLEFLAEHVPVFQTGEFAQERLNSSDGVLSTDERSTLLRQVADGRNAQDILVRASIPLVRGIAYKEYSRKGGRAKGVRAEVEDLFQEGMAGLLQGLRKYNPAATKSATHYLGSWVRTIMRRNMDSLEHAFSFGQVTTERFQRINATRTRLQQELGRAPTDAEIQAGWLDTTYLPGRIMGRLDKDAQAKTTVTARQLAEEREYGSRMGAKMLADGADGENTEQSNFELSRPVDGATGLPDVESQVDDRAEKEFLSTVLTAAFELLRVAAPQRHVLQLKFGLDGHPETGLTSIVSATRISRPKVTAVVDAFTAEMARPQGAFHQVCARYSDEDLLEVGLGWVSSVLGPFTGDPRGAYPSPDLLTIPTQTTDRKPPPPARVPNERPGLVLAQFLCSRHPEGFTGAYRDRGDIPSERGCNRCDQPARLIRVRETG